MQQRCSFLRNKRLIAAIIGIAVACALLPVISCSAKKNIQGGTTGTLSLPVSDTLSLESACRIIAHHAPVEFGATDTVVATAFFRLLDSAGEAIRSTPGFKPASPVTRKAILDLVYKTWQIGFDSADTSLESLLPDRVYRQHKGGCLGVSLLILMLAERLSCPLYGVVLPGHFFCRYDDGSERVNIEPNRGGCTHDDAYYRAHYPIDKLPWYDLKNLSRPKTIGVLCFNCGTLCLRKKLVAPAIGYLRECLHLMPSLAEAKGNLAVAYARSGSADTALSLFAELSSECPDMVNLARNYGMVAAAAGRYRKAMEIYCAGLERNPTDSLLFRRATGTLSRLGKDDSPEVFEKRLKTIRDGK
jgi:regulator of sirC expression with transglutaminase-like and TPR domain